MDPELLGLLGAQLLKQLPQSWLFSWILKHMLGKNTKKKKYIYQKILTQFLFNIKKIYVGERKIYY
jgi:hypothetical protein